MPGVMEMRLHVANKMREIAAKSCDPTKIRAAIAYAGELERAAGIEQLPFMACDQRGPGTSRRHAKASEVSEATPTA